jgi:hypothetical protein
MVTTIMGVRKVARCSVDIQTQFVPDTTNPVGATLQTGVTTYVMSFKSGNITSTTRSLSDSFVFPTDSLTKSSMIPTDGLSGNTQLWELTTETVDRIPEA